jgi:hypothetical protein
VVAGAFLELPTSPPRASTQAVTHFACKTYADSKRILHSLSLP